MGIIRKTNLSLRETQHKVKNDFEKLLRGAGAVVG
jgi:hypothetical protein